METTIPGMASPDVIKILIAMADTLETEILSLQLALEAAPHSFSSFVETYQIQNHLKNRKQMEL